MVAFFNGDPGSDRDAVREAIASCLLALPPAVLCELLSEPHLDVATANLIQSIDTLPVREGFWQRAGLLRAGVLGRGRRARLGDALIAQSCIDHDVPLITRDADFRHFARWARLRLVATS